MWRAVYSESCTYGSGESSGKPTDSNIDKASGAYPTLFPERTELQGRGSEVAEHRIGWYCSTQVTESI